VANTFGLPDFVRYIQWRSERGVWGVQAPPLWKMCMFYCLWLNLHFFNSVRNSLSDDLNVHSGIKETRVCDCVTDYRDAAYIYGLPVYCIHIVKW